jgi:hypothetical protein
MAIDIRIGMARRIARRWPGMVRLGANFRVSLKRNGCVVYNIQISKKNDCISTSVQNLEALTSASMGDGELDYSINNPNLACLHKLVTENGVHMPLRLKSKCL